MGRGEKNLSDQAAVDAMRRAFDALHIHGTVVIGEGERDEAPMLYIGEKVGAAGRRRSRRSTSPSTRWRAPTSAPTGGPARSRWSRWPSDGNLLNAPDTYMEKIAVGPQARGAIDLRKSPTENLRAIAAGAAAARWTT